MVARGLAVLSLHPRLGLKGLWPSLLVSGRAGFVWSWGCLCHPREVREFTSFVITGNQVPMNHPLSLDGVQPLQVSRLSNRCTGEQRSGCVATCVPVVPSAYCQVSRRIRQGLVRERCNGGDSLRGQQESNICQSSCVGVRRRGCHRSSPSRQARACWRSRSRKVLCIFSACSVRSSGRDDRHANGSGEHEGHS